jgi:hypothetical protein
MDYLSQKLQNEAPGRNQSAMCLFSLEMVLSFCATTSEVPTMSTYMNRSKRDMRTLINQELMNGMAHSKGRHGHIEWVHKATCLMAEVTTLID